MTTNYETAIGFAISDLVVKLQASGFEAGTDLVAFEIIIDLIHEIESGGDSAFPVDLPAITMTYIAAIYKAAIYKAIYTLEHKLQRYGVDAADFTTLSGLRAAIDVLNTVTCKNDTDIGVLQGQIDTLTTRIDSFEAIPIDRADQNHNAVSTSAYEAIADENELDNVVAIEAARSSHAMPIEPFNRAGYHKAGIEYGKAVDGIGSEVIYLNFQNDQSGDNVVYVTIKDRRTAEQIDILMPKDDMLYREGLVLPLCVNGEEYFYTIATEDEKTPLQVLTNLAQVMIDEGAPIRFFNVRQSHAGPHLIVTGETGVGLDIAAGGDITAIIENVGQVVAVDVVFPSLQEHYPTATNTDHTTVFDRELSVEINGKVVAAGVVFNDDGTPDQEASVRALKDSVLIAATDGATTAITPASVNLGVISGLDSYTLASATVTINGNSQRITAMAPIHCLLDAIEALPLCSSAVLNDLGEVVITADVRGIDAASNTLEVNISLDTVNSAFGFASATGGSLSGVIGNASAEGTTLTLLGSKPLKPETEAPCFTVTAAKLDQNGKQLDTLVSFSSDNADYRDGGELSVEINGETVTVSMVPGDAVASVKALTEAIECERLGILLNKSASTVYKAPFALDSVTEETLLNIGDITETKMTVALKANTISLFMIVRGDGSYVAGPPGNYIPEAPDVQAVETVGDLIEFLNKVFDGVMKFTFSSSGIFIETFDSHELEACDGGSIETALTTSLRAYVEYEGSGGSAAMLAASIFDPNAPIDPVPRAEIELQAQNHDFAFLERAVQSREVVKSALTPASSRSIIGGAINRYNDIDTAMLNGNLGVYNEYTFEGFTVSVTETDLTASHVDALFLGTFGGIGVLKFASWEDFDAAWSEAFSRALAASIEVTTETVSSFTSITVRDLDLTGTPQSAEFIFIEFSYNPEIILTAATEGPDPLIANVSMTYP
jgi:hypothetical protein